MVAELRDRNVIYETEMKGLGLLKHERKVREAKAQEREGTVHPYNGLVARMLSSAEATLKERTKKRRGPSLLGVEALKQSKLDLQLVCGIAARTIVDGISMGHRLQTITERIGMRVEDEVRMREFRKREPALFAWMQQRFKEKSTQDYGHKRAVLMAALRRADSDEQWKPWDTKTKAGLGILLVDAFVQAGFVETVQKHVDKKARMTLQLQLTVDAERALALADEAGKELLKPWYKPTLEVPVDWTDPEVGGYLTLDLPMMKTRRRQDIERLRSSDMPIVYDALNAIQRTPWRINQDVLVTAQELRRLEVHVEGLPLNHEYSRPVRPDLPPMGEELDEQQKELLSKFKGARRIWHDMEARRRSRNTQALQILGVAEELADEEAIYFPCQLDYRGRAYAVPIQLNPQGNDLAKGLLTFAEGRPLGEMGGYWLGVHGANTWGVDKGALNDRVDWVLENEERIRRVAADPLADLWWTEADKGKKPWQFLAWCLEWAAYLDSGESPDFISHLPVSVDGSCNGLQHFAAMMRDPLGARAVNLSADGTQHDIYTEVAERTLELVRAKRHMSATDAELAGLWLKVGITRSVVKRPVMTTPYGATPIGMKQMVLDDTITPLRAAGEDFGPRPWEAAGWLAELIYEAIGETISAAQEAMSFLQKLATITATEDQAIAWTTPCGLPVVQYIHQISSFVIDTALLGRIQLHYAATKPELDRRRQRTSVAPNFVHSLDASHLMLTVVAAEKQAGRPLSWAMVHDSFGTHAGDLDRLSRVLREQFVGMYRDRDPLGDLREAVVGSVPEGTDVPLPPVPGSFDLEEVLKAEFFFA